MYALHIENMTAEERATFEQKVNADPAEMEAAEREQLAEDQRRVFAMMGGMA